MNKNFDKLLGEIIENNKEKGIVPRVLLHSCCAPCSSYVIEYLSDYFYLTILYYNPNISPKDEYIKRKNEQVRLISEMKTKYKVDIIDCDYDNEIYENLVKGLENEPERGRRCEVCFGLRLEKTAMMAKKMEYDYFGTTLTVSPYKNSLMINEIGSSIGDKLGIKYLVSDFKKRNGYKRSIELSREHNLYRQNYCGCKYSKAVYEDTLRIKEQIGNR